MRDMLDKSLIQAALKCWDLENPYVEGRLQERSPRLILRIGTDAGRFVLKGFPFEVPEATIKSNVQAHLFLGNEKGRAPKLYPSKMGEYYICDQGYWFYLMEFVDGRQMEETSEDEFRIGQALRWMHGLEGYSLKSPEDQSKKRFYEWFRERGFVKEFDAILDELPDFEKLDQCLIHSDAGPHNMMLWKDGEAIFVDLDDTGIGSRYLDLGWPLIMQFVDFNHDTREMKYRFDLAESFLRGYCGEEGLTREEFDLIFYGAEQMHISYMKSYTPKDVENLWKILVFGIAQKEALWDRLCRQ